MTITCIYDIIYTSYCNNGGDLIKVQIQVCYRNLEAQIEGYTKNLEYLVSANEPILDEIHNIDGYNNLYIYSNNLEIELLSDTILLDIPLKIFLKGSYMFKILNIVNNRTYSCDIDEIDSNADNDFETNKKYVKSHKRKRSRKKK